MNLIKRKPKDKKTLSDIILIISFFIVILVPVLFMNFKRNQVSYIDNRKLLEIEDIFREGKVFENIKSYVDDRIGFRTKIVDLYSEAMDSLFHEITHPRYEYGREDFIMSKAEENEFNPEFMDIYADFIKGFQDYCNERNIKFLYAVEPRKELIYPEYITKGFNYENIDIEYFIELLKEKEINYLNNVETLKEAKEEGVEEALNKLYLDGKTTENGEIDYNDINSNLLFDQKYDARHWNEAGAIIGISTIIDRLSLLDNRVDKFNLSNYKVEEYINETLVASNFKIDEKTNHFNLINDNSIYIEDLEDEIVRHESFRNFTHYKNSENEDAPRILIFAGSYFDNKEKFITESFSEVMKIHNYRNVIDYEYYINIFNPDIVLFESTEYTHFNFYFPDNDMKNKIHMKSLEYFMNNKGIKEENFVTITKVNKYGEDLTNFSVEIQSNEDFFAYAYINNRALDCKVKEADNKRFVEFSIMTSEIKNIDSFDLYFVSQDKYRYQRHQINLE
ncbi:alginate O-acetyltransferase [Clostridium nigeriense]|uniref:alginate O-acetyltransferase n=1 Tax=Clostridium nigeriense TaxID=1805470 RepID=UPI000834BE21|nr:alginate O-acetyltransferase [Clostridium nigeriense]